jgi:phosphoglycerate dehydrogenase-like enzyme
MAEREPRMELVREHDLLPPKRFPGDHRGDPGFRRDAAAEARFHALLDSAEALFGIPVLDPAALRRTVRANPRLRWVHTMAAGGGSAVRAATLTRDELDRVAFTTSAGVHARPLAEFSLLGLLAGAKNLPRLQAAQARAEWEGRWFMGQLAHLSVLVVGLGGVGREVARLLAAFGCRVVGTSRRPGVRVEGVDETVSPTDLGAAAARVDGIVVALPGTLATEGLVGAEVLAGVRPGTTLVNVGRGTVVDEPALVAALRDGRIGYAALDVTAREPLPADTPLWTMPNVLLSPHTAALDTEEDRRIARLFAENAGLLVEGRPLRNRVDTVEFY